mgnify:CR=1 FL=1|tara:strand:+ start:381 stop:785 length:405 start_codon:yes stop_codon:yes gene_type:complete
MSAWGISNFENDSALNWIENLIEQADGSSIDGAIKSFVTSFDSEETSLIECSKFLAVAEVLAGLLGSPSEDFPDELTDWVETKYIKIEQDIIDKAKEGVALIIKDSEAKEMYLGSGYQKSWDETQNGLLKRLSE